jgi:hypothetical protein
MNEHKEGPMETISIIAIVLVTGIMAFIAGFILGIKAGINHLTGMLQRKGMGL